ncbi:hypothetical protein BHE74_00037244 [Ensete ventricosum]|nr:hypothetical protein GW17_00022041 [Ensete ventricosum]RWW56074.1 hypothetical protein BHE74_00037244 [Ensete ventricosum]
MCRSPFVARAARGLLISPKPTSTVVSLTDLGSLQKAKHRKGGTGWVQKENGTASGQGLLQSYFQFLSVSRLIGFEVAIVMSMRRQNERDEGADCVEFRERESMRAGLTVEREGAWGIPMKS